jgi:DNA-binding NtrC family response regulator
VAPAALARFADYEFPGNVRELENKVHQAMVVAAGPLIEEHDVALPVARGAAVRVDVSRPFRDVKQETIDAFETSYLTELLRVHQGNLAQAARAAGMDRKNLWALVERHGLDRERFKKP